MLFIADTVWTYIHDMPPVGIAVRKIKEVTSYLEDGYFHSPAFKKGHWDGRTNLIKYDRKKQLYRFPTGLLSIVCGALDSIEYSYKIEDNRTFETAEPLYTLLDDRGEPNVILNTGKWSYQGAALDAALAKGSGVIVFPTGGGKTELAAAILQSIGKQSCFLTHRKNLAYQTQERLSRRLGVPIGIVGDGVMDIQPITVVMVQTAATCSPELRPELYKFLTTCEVLIGDEIHHAESAETWWDQIVQIPAQWRFGLSATPNFTGQGLALVGLMGEVVYKVSLLELIERRVLVIPRIWFVRVDSPMLDKKMAWVQAYKNGVVYAKLRNEKLTQVARTFQYEEKSCITLVKRIGHGDLLTDQFHRAKVRTDFIRGEIKQSQRDDIFGRLKDGSLHNVVAMDSIVGEGTDLPWLRAVVNATGSRGGGNKAKGDTGRSTLQFLGRVIRSYPGKDYADYVDVADLVHPNLKSAASDRANTLLSEGYGPFLKFWEDYRLDD